MQNFSPRLTTVYQDAPRMGREAARLLIAQIENRPFPESVIVPVRLLRGETVAPVT
jgi:DNA-binding LacI/PurR family transcriptional regulator